MEKWVIPAIGVLGAGIGGYLFYNHWLHTRFYGTWTAHYGEIEVMDITFKEDKTFEWMLFDVVELLEGTWTVLDGQHIRFDAVLNEKEVYIYWLYIMEPLTPENETYLLLTAGENNMDIEEGWKVDLLKEV